MEKPTLNGRYRTNLLNSYLKTQPIGIQETAWQCQKYGDLFKLTSLSGCPDRLKV